MKLVILLSARLILFQNSSFSQHIEGTFISSSDLEIFKGSKLYVVQGLVDSEKGDFYL